MNPLIAAILKIGTQVAKTTIRVGSKVGAKVLTASVDVGKKVGPKVVDTATKAKSSFMSRFKKQDETEYKTDFDLDKSTQQLIDEANRAVEEKK